MIQYVSLFEKSVPYHDFLFELYIVSDRSISYNVKCRPIRSIDARRPLQMNYILHSKVLIKLWTSGLY